MIIIIQKKVPMYIGTFFVANNNTKRLLFNNEKSNPLISYTRLNYRTSFLYLILFGAVSPKRFLRFSSYSENEPSKAYT